MALFTTPLFVPKSNTRIITNHYVCMSLDGLPPFSNVFPLAHPLQTTYLIQVPSYPSLPKFEFITDFHKVLLALVLPFA